MTLAWLAVLALTTGTTAWAVALRRAVNHSVSEVSELNAHLHQPAAQADARAALRAAAMEISRVRGELESSGQALGKTFGSWTQTLGAVMDEIEQKRKVPVQPESLVVPRSRLTVAGPENVRSEGSGIVFAIDPGAFPNRPPRGSSLERTPLETLGLQRDLPVTFVVPTMWVPQSDTTSSRWAVVTEDVLGVRAVDERLRRSWPEAEVRTRITDGRDTRPPDEGNVCSFCRDVRNPVTAALLHHPRTRELFGIELGFWPTTRNEREMPLEWGLVFPDGMPRTSPSYEQERQFEAARDMVSSGGSAGEEEVVLDDFALLARFPNPFGGGTALIVAGIRALGTWGAAEYLRRHSGELHERTQGGSFVSFMRVRGTYNVYPTEADGAVTLLVASHDKPTEVVEELDFRLIAA